jgi:hypothetical protein
VTAKWLTSALAETGILTQGVVTDAEWRTIGEAYGFASLIGRVGLRYRGANADAPSSLVAKLPSAELWEQGAREVRFYEKVAATPAPTVYYAAADHTRRRGILLLEDLSEGRQGDVLEGCSVDDARRVLEAIAPFHARWWGSDRSAGWIRHDSRDPEARQARFDAHLDQFVELDDVVVPRHVRAVLERLRSRLAGVIEQLDGGPRTLIHADLHLDNLLFDARPDRRIVVLDWQTVRLGNPASDVAFFVFDSLGIEDRRPAERELLEAYAALLAEHGVRDYDADRLLRDCLLALLVLLAGMVGWLTRPSSSRARERALREASFPDGRLVTALRDHDVGSLLDG